MKSILQTEKECWVCKCKDNLHEHHVLPGTANRAKSEMWGLKVWLCAYHHDMSSEGVHENAELRYKLIRYAQETFELLYGHELWMRTFHKNYL